MNVTVYAGRKDGEIRNFWNHIVFHPTDAIEDDWGQKILNQIAEDHAAKTVRIYNMFEDIVTPGADGQPVYDYTLNDYRIDYLLAHGFTPMISYAFLPPFLAQDAAQTSSMSKNKKRYKGKMIVTAPPKDYGMWETLCREYTAHLVDRYGEDKSRISPPVQTVRTAIGVSPLPADPFCLPRMSALPTTWQSPWRRLWTKMDMRNFRRLHRPRQCMTPGYAGNLPARTEKRFC